MAPRDTYADLVNSAAGRRAASTLGLPRPARLRRYAAGGPLIDGPVVVGGHGTAPLAMTAAALLRAEGIDTLPSVERGERAAAVVADLSEVSDPGDLETLRALVAPALKGLSPSGRVIVLGRPPSEAGDPAGGSANGSAGAVARAAARRALEGITRSIGKELRGGSTANLVLVAQGADDQVEATLRFLLSGRSAYVSGQVIHVGPAGGGSLGGRSAAGAGTDWTRPLAGQVAVVTGAARGIGSAIADVLARDGARVVCVDVPAAGDALAATANRVGGTALQVDVTAPDAGARIVDHAVSRHGGLDIVVHNAGITRDRLLVNTDADRWSSVIDVNLGSVLRMNEAILAPGGLRDGGHVVCVSSIAGLAGNRGQSNYAASKAGVIGLVEALAEEVRDRGITVNAVAPGFIETEMTARIPLATREVGRRLNSVAQGGLPLDVAETIAWLAQDANAGVTGATVRVCGQSLLGA